MSTIIKKHFRDISVPSYGIEVGQIFGSKYQTVNGLIKQIIVEKKSGSGTVLPSIQIRYISGDDSPSELIYFNTNCTLASNFFSDSFIDAPFSLISTIPTNIYFYMESDVVSVYSIRIEIETFV